MTQTSQKHSTQSELDIIKTVVQKKNYQVAYELLASKG